MPEPIVDTTIERFACPGLHGREMQCRIRALVMPDGRSVVIATELADNPGASVTNAAEQLATAVSYSLQIPLMTLVWIEHYPADRVRPEATFDLVTFKRVDSKQWQLVKPDWRRMTADDWSELGIQMPTEES